MSFQPASQRDLVHLMENREKASTEAFSELLDEIVRLNGCGWELGPDPADITKDILAFSTLGDRANVDRIREEMDLPLTGDDWSVIIGIPPRIWDRYFEYTAANGSVYEIEGLSWRYSMIETGGRAEILLDPSPNKYPAICEELARILCVGELGEENLDDFVSAVSCANLASSEGKPLSYLREDFVRRFPACHYDTVFRSDGDSVPR